MHVFYHYFDIVYVVSACVVVLWKLREVLLNKLLLYVCPLLNFDRSFNAPISCSLIFASIEFLRKLLIEPLSFLLLNECLKVNSAILYLADPLLPLCQHLPIFNLQKPLKLSYLALFPTFFLHPTYLLNLPHIRLNSLLTILISLILIRLLMAV